MTPSSPRTGEMIIAREPNSHFRRSERNPVRGLMFIAPGSKNSPPPFGAELNLTGIVSLIPLRTAANIGWGWQVYKHLTSNGVKNLARM
jgi:hypothetical protein